jgi:hypothetical protein
VISSVSCTVVRCACVTPWSPRPEPVATGRPPCPGVSAGTPPDPRPSGPRWSEEAMPGQVGRSSRASAGAPRQVGARWRYLRRRGRSGGLPPERPVGAEGRGTQ